MCILAKPRVGYRMAAGDGGSGEIVSVIFFLIKFFENADYAMDFVNGNIFTNTLATFKDLKAVTTLAGRIGMKARLRGCAVARLRGCSRV